MTVILLLLLQWVARWRGRLFDYRSSGLLVRVLGYKVRWDTLEGAFRGSSCLVVATSCCRIEGSFCTLVFV